jgi:hypothetical protein
MDNWIAILLKQVLLQMSPGIRQALVDFVNKLESDAKGTKNVWDDIGVGLLKYILFMK